MTPAVVVYPMNALINSQTEEFESSHKSIATKRAKIFQSDAGNTPGQEDEAARQKFHEQTAPTVLLTNYMMLEYMLTRLSERDRRLRDAILRILGFSTVLGELHTLTEDDRRSDVSLLIRRIRAKCEQAIVASKDNLRDQ